MLCGTIVPHVVYNDFGCKRVSRCSVARTAATKAPFALHFPSVFGLIKQAENYYSKQS